jgi:ribonuclease BN (tRNA processing enzyme)
VIRRLLLVALLSGLIPNAMAQACNSGVALQVLGSGGPDLAARRAGSSYLIWVDGKARVLIDAGGGSALRFGESGAKMSDVDVLLLTDLHADHTSDLPALIQSSTLEERARPLPIFGPAGDRQMPATVALVRALFDGTRGAYRHLGELLSPLDKSKYKLEPRDVREPPAKIGAPRRTATPVLPVFANERVRVSAMVISQAGTPELSFRIESGGKIFVVSRGAMTDAGLAALALGADLLIAQDTITGDNGRLATAASAKQLVLVHRTPATLGHEDESLAAIRRHYAGTVHFSDDLACYHP